MMLQMKMKQRICTYSNFQNFKPLYLDSHLKGPMTAGCKKKKKHFEYQQRVGGLILATGGTNYGVNSSPEATERTWPESFSKLVKRKLFKDFSHDRLFYQSE